MTAPPSLWLHPAFDIQHEPDDSPLFAFGFEVEEEGKRGRLEVAPRHVISASGRVEVVEGDATPRYHHVRLRFRRQQGPIAKLAQQWGAEEFAEAEEAAFPAPTGSELYRRHAEAWRQHVHFDHPGQYVIAACWGVLTYVYPTFLSLPFLHFLGDKESGKSQALDLLQALVRDGQKVRPTPASVGDLIEARRPTLLMDQVDYLSDQMVDLLADSYRHGARRVVVIQSNRGRETREFETFGPKAFAGTEPLPDDLRDRAIILHMSRSSRRLPPVRPGDPELQATRAASYTWALRWGWVLPSLRDVMLVGGWAIAKVWPTLAELAGRPYDLWLPIECLMEALWVSDADREAAREYYAQSCVATTTEPPPARLELVQALWELAEAEKRNAPAFVVTRSELEAKLNKASSDLSEPAWNAQKIGRQLSALVGVLAGKPTRSQDRKDTLYVVKRPVLRIWAGRYGLTK